MMEKYGMYNQKNSTVEKEYKRSKFINSGGEIVHKKGIPIEHWDEAEFEEHEKLYKEMLEKRAKREQEKKEYYESFDQDDMVTEEIIQAAIKRYQEQHKASDWLKNLNVSRIQGESPKTCNQSPIGIQLR